jgi:tetratricopeptide (TPR) repeat protein
MKCHAKAGASTAFAAVVVAMLALAGCSRREAANERPSENCPPSEQVVDQRLLAWLSKARTLHHLADMSEADGAIDHAIASLEQLTGAEAPRTPEADEVLADTYARLADLRVRQGDLQRAERDVDEGLRHAPGPTYFHGHLLEVRGLVFEKLSESLAKAGKRAEAEEARLKAMRASLEAVRIQDEIIGHTLDNGSTPKTAASANPVPTSNAAPTSNKRDR